MVVGSHGSARTGEHARHRGIASLICHDAGVGLDEAGVAALALLDMQRVPAAAVSHLSARIGDPRDMVSRGRLSRTNEAARALGLCVGMGASEAHALLVRRTSPEGTPSTLPAGGEFRRIEHYMDIPGAQRPLRITVLDSASSVGPEDGGAIVVTGSHGGLPGNEPANALRARPRVVVFNDAGIGIEQAGTRRLPILGTLGIAAVCVDAATARIGDGLSTLETGVISVTNGPAAVLGAEAGKALRDWLAILAQNGCVADGRQEPGTTL